MLEPCSTEQGRLQHKHPYPKDFDEHMTWRIRWYLIIAITIVYTLSLVGGLLGLWMTKDPRYLLFIAPTALIPFVRYLVPMDKRKYDLELAKINVNKELYGAKARIQVLEDELRKQREQQEKGQEQEGNLPQRRVSGVRQRKSAHDPMKSEEAS